MLSALRWVVTLAALMSPTVVLGQSQAQKHFALLERAVEAIEHSRKTLDGIKAVQAELKREYQENEEKPLTDTIRDRQPTIAIYYGELERLSHIVMTQIRPPIQPDDMDRKLKDYFRRYAEDDGSGVFALPDNLGETFFVLERRLSKLRVERNPRLSRGLFQDSSFRDYSVDLSGKPNETVGEGAFAVLREPLHQLLKLSWDDDRWTIDRTHWDDLFLGKTRQQIFGEVKELLAARGVELPELERPRLRFGPRGDGWAPANEQPNVVHLFENLKSHTQRAGSHFSGGDTLRMHSRGSDVELGLVYNDDAEFFEFRISEFEGVQRTLVVRQEDQGRLHILILGDRLVRLDQDASGRITVLDSSPDRNRQFQEDSAALLCEKHTNYVRNELFPLLDEMGIMVPSMR